MAKSRGVDMSSMINNCLTKLCIIAGWLYSWVQLDRAELRSLPILWSKNNFPLLCPRISNSLSTSWQLGHKRSQFGNNIEIFNTVMLIRTSGLYSFNLLHNIYDHGFFGSFISDTEKIWRAFYFSAKDIPWNTSFLLQYSPLIWNQQHHSSQLMMALYIVYFDRV